MAGVSEATREAMAELLAAEATFLRSMRWVPLVPIVPGAPIWWRSPDREEYQQDYAVTLAKIRFVQFTQR